MNSLIKIFIPGDETVYQCKYGAAVFICLTAAQLLKQFTEHVWLTLPFLESESERMRGRVVGKTIYTYN